MKSARMLVSTLFLACAGCSDDGTPVHTQTDDVIASALLRKAEGTDSVWGRLTVRGKHRILVSAELYCFTLRVGASESRDLRIDSLIDYATGGWAARDGDIDIAVYWSNTDFMTVTDADLGKAKLEIIAKNSKPCFEFAPATQ